MGIQQAIRRLFAFDRPDAEFELLETERGEPSMLGGWREAYVPKEETPAPPSARTEENRRRLSYEYRASINPDLILRSFQLGGNHAAFIAFINGMADGDQINDFILRPCMHMALPEEKPESMCAYLLENVLCMQDVEISDDWTNIKRAVSEGRTALFTDGEARAVILDTRGFIQRGVTEPTNETVIMGPREAFTESIRTNVTLLRRIVKTDDFVCEFRASGGRNNNRIVIAYRQGVANESLVGEVKKRIAKVDTLMVLSAGTIEQMTERKTFSPLPQSLSTERPDRAAALVMQGNVVVIVEGSPIVSVMPATLFLLMSSAEDAYLRAPVGSIIRLVRYIGSFLSIIMPGYFIALTMHHQGMLSSEVLATVIASRNMVFLPLPVEMIFLLLVFQLVREAGLSVPGVMGQSVGIIGGLILGQAAVAANIVSTVVLIIVALTGLGNFTIRDYQTQLAAAYFRTLLVLVAWLGGLLGISCALLLTVAWMATLKSYGVPFLAPVSPKTYARGPVVLRGRVTPKLRANDYVNAGGGMFER